MSVNKRPPAFVPAAHYAEVMALTKAALADMVWDYAQQIAGSDVDTDIMREFRERAEMILTYRKQVP